ncbi:hypothetical protein Mhun_2378 [Methanospirillum hungatei JF-1]|jgi:hypothetical protein|uniref:Uncharacterized protein n=1 Tax=Methanospirillum hungatei JF-1 (strain ATCC 27890 / DSM 864 / NBRC 100397 / JF-1) TaxID=323259 RepID=Q2FT17_METHJ|nr:hypothetical protein Mhun_2378 [Methanospirillum hungatei JF-1]
MRSFRCTDTTLVQSNTAMTVITVGLVNAENNSRKCIAENVVRVSNHPNLEIVAYLAAEEERVVGVRDADKRHHGPSPVPAGSSSTIPQNQSVPSSSRTGWAAAWFFYCQWMISRGPGMRR